MSQPGTKIGQRFVLRHPLGRGGMAEVWLAWDEKLQTDVALKLLVPKVVLDAEGLNRFRTRFRREADAIRRLDSPHIVRLVDFGDDTAGELYMALSYVNGKPLSQVLREEGAQPPNRVREIARQMATGLEVAHASGVMHRDLKPANVMMTRTAQGRDHVVLVDFGIAHVLRSATGETLTRITSEGSMIGTPRYLPPEYIRGDSFDERSDLFSLGLILYEMLEGRAAVAGEDTVQIIARHLDQAPFRLSPHVAQRDPGLTSIVHALLEKRPEARLQTAAALRQALLDGGFVPAQTAVEPTRPIDAGDEDRADITTIAAAIFILFLAVAGGFLLFGRTDVGADETTEVSEETIVVDEADVFETAERQKDEARQRAYSMAIDEANLKTALALVDARAGAENAAKPKEEPLPEEAVEEVADGRQKKKGGFRLRLPENETMDEIRQVIPSLTVE